MLTITDKGGLHKHSDGGYYGWAEVTNSFGTRKTFQVNVEGVSSSQQTVVQGNANGRLMAGAKRKIAWHIPASQPVAEPQLWNISVEETNW